MVMLEEFRRRKNLQRYYEQMKAQKHEEHLEIGERDPLLDMDDEAITKDTQYK
jgi:hypothetical protein